MVKQAKKTIKNLIYRIKSFVTVLTTNLIKERESSKTLITNMTRVIRVDIKIAIIVWGIYILMIYIGYKMGYEITGNIAYLDSIPLVDSSTTINSSLNSITPSIPIKVDKIKVLILCIENEQVYSGWVLMYPEDVKWLLKVTDREFAEICVRNNSRIVGGVICGIIDTTEGFSGIDKQSLIFLKNIKDVIFNNG